MAHYAPFLFFAVEGGFEPPRSS